MSKPPSRKGEVSLSIPSCKKLPLRQKPSRLGKPWKTFPAVNCKARPEWTVSSDHRSIGTTATWKNVYGLCCSVWMAICVLFNFLQRFLLDLSFWRCWSFAFGVCSCLSFSLTWSNPTRKVLRSLYWRMFALVGRYEVEETNSTKPPGYTPEQFF